MHRGYSPGKIGPITPLATSSSRCTSSQASSSGCRWGGFARMGMALVRSRRLWYFGSQTRPMSVWTTTSLSSQGNKQRKKACHMASSTMSPNWHLESAQYLQRARSGGSSLPLSSIIKSRSRSHARTISTSSSTGSPAFRSHPGRVFCSSSWMIPTLAAWRPPASSSLAWW